MIFKYSLLIIHCARVAIAVGLLIMLKYRVSVHNHNVQRVFCVRPTEKKHAGYFPCGAKSQRYKQFTERVSSYKAIAMH